MFGGDCAEVGPVVRILREREFETARRQDSRRRVQVKVELERNEDDEAQTQNGCGVRLSQTHIVTSHN